MKILLASKFGPHGTRPIGGVQTWVATVAQELRCAGHEVGLWEAGQKEPSERYDLGIFANMGYTNHMVKRCNFVVQVSHGIIEPERPAYPKVAFTSEGVRDHWQTEGPIVRQPIDLNFWKPSTSSKRKFLVRFSYRKGLDFAREVAARLDLEYVHISSLQHEAVREILRDAACVLATGRAALEAMACDAPVVICDHRSSYQGPLMDRDLVHAMQHNYSGRGGIVPTMMNLEFAVKQAIIKGGQRFHVERFHDAKDITTQLLSLRWESVNGKLECVA